MRFLATEKLSSHKYKTPEGYLVCVDAVLSRTGKQEYYRNELFGDSCEDADKKIAVDRLESDVFDEKALASFENKPVCIEHPNEDVNVANHNELSVGFVRDIKRGKDNGQDVMLGTLVITDESAISAIESGEYTELSCGYDCDIRDEENPRQTNIRGNHVALCKHGRAGIARIVDSIGDDEVDWLIALDEHGIKYSFINGGYAMKFKSNADYALARKLANIHHMTSGHWDDKSLTHSDYRSTTISNDDSFEKLIQANELTAGMRINYRGQVYTVEKVVPNKLYHGECDLYLKTDNGGQRVIETGETARFSLADDMNKDANTMKDTSTTYNGFMHMLQQYSMHAQQLERIVEAIRGANDLSTSEKQMLVAKANSYLASLARMDDSVGDIQATSAPGTDRIIYVMQSDVDENLFFYIGKTFSMKEGMWGYTKFEMGDTTPDELKADLTKHGWHQVAKGPAKVIDMHDADRNRLTSKRPLNSKTTDAEHEYEITAEKYGPGNTTKHITVFAASEIEAINYAKRKLGNEWRVVEHARRLDSKERRFTIEYKQDCAMHIYKVRANSIEDAIIKVKDEVSTAHKVVVFTQNILSEMGKNNSIGKYDKVISAMRQLYGQSLLPDNELKEAIRRKLPRILTKYGL